MIQGAGPRTGRERARGGGGGGGVGTSGAMYSGVPQAVLQPDASVPSPSSLEYPKSHSFSISLCPALCSSMLSSCRATSMKVCGGQYQQPLQETSPLSGGDLLTSCHCVPGVPTVR